MDDFIMLKSVPENKRKEFLSSLSEKELENLRFSLKFAINETKNIRLVNSLKSSLRNEPTCDYDLTHRYCAKCKKSISLQLCQCKK